MGSPAPSAHLIPSLRPGRIPFTYHAIPKELLRAGELSLGAVVLFSIVRNLAVDRRDGARVCTKSNGVLAEELGRSPSDVGRYLRELESAGCVRRLKGASQRSRVGIVVTWVSSAVEGEPDVIPLREGYRRAPMPKVEHEATRAHAEGSASSVPKGEHGLARLSASTHVGCSASLKNLLKEREEPFQEADPDFHPRSRSEEDPDEAAKPSPAEIAAALRSMANKTWRGTVPADRRSSPATAQAAERGGEPSPEHLATIGGMFGRVGYSATATAYKRRGARKTAAEQIAELRRRTVEGRTTSVPDEGERGSTRLGQG